MMRFFSGLFGRSAPTLSEARPNDAVADEPRQSSVVLGIRPGNQGFEARDGASPVHDEDRRAALEAIDQGAEVVFGFGNTGYLHLPHVA